MRRPSVSGASNNVTLTQSAREPSPCSRLIDLSVRNGSGPEASENGHKLDFQDYPDRPAYSIHDAVS